MAMFLAEISFLLALAVFGFGLMLWHRGREAPAGPLRLAGAVLVVGAVLTALCTGYFSVRYQLQGEFDHAHFTHPPMAGPGMMGPGHPGMGPGMMQPGMQTMPMHPGTREDEPEGSR